MINAWTLYQAETCVVWSRFASFIEVGGRTGLGYRDTAQDAISVPHANPKMTRKRIVDLLRGQVKAGYGLHLFDPDWFDPEKQMLNHLSLQRLFLLRPMKIRSTVLKTLALMITYG